VVGKIQITASLAMSQLILMEVKEQRE